MDIIRVIRVGSGNVRVQWSDTSTELLSLERFQREISRYKVIRRGASNTRYATPDGLHSFLVPTRAILGSTLDMWQPIKFGVELEFCCPRSSVETLKRKLAEVVNFRDASTRHGVPTQGQWVLTYDGSLTDGPGHKAFELVSPVLNFNNREDLKKVLTVMNDLDCFVTRKCGTHCHFSFQRLPTREEAAEFFYAYHRWEVLFDKLVSPSRRGNVNRYCQSCVSNDPYNSRYHKLNVRALDKHGTIEIRQHQGTLSFTKISHWVDLMAAFFKNHTKDCTNDPAVALADLGVTSTEWYINRIAELSD